MTWHKKEEPEETDSDDYEAKETEVFSETTSSVRSSKVDFTRPRARSILVDKLVKQCRALLYPAGNLGL